MKPLLERLSKENFDKIMNCEYKKTGDLVINELESCSYWSAMTLEIAILLYTNILGMGYFDLNKFINLFNNDEK